MIPRVTIRFAILASLSLGVCAKAAQPPAGGGHEAFNNHCRECHSFKANDNRLGPSLFGVFGRKAANVQGFPYSDAMKSSELTWDEGTLDRFIANPDSVVSNNGMRPFPGVADAQERAKIIAFLKENH